MRKKLIVLIIIICITLLFASCEIDWGLVGDYLFENLDLIIADTIFMQEGEFNIYENIDDLRSFVEQLGLSVSLVVYDEDENLIDVTGEKFLVEEGKTYTCTLSVTNSEGETKTKTFQIVGIKNTQTSITFDYGISQDYKLLTIGQAANRPAMDDIPLREGYVFLDWYADSNFTNKYNFETPINYETTIYAKWHELSINDIVMTYETNGGCYIEPTIQEVGANIDEPVSPTREGFTFQGWYRDSELTQEFIFETMPNENLTIYASWIEDEEK